MLNFIKLFLFQSDEYHLPAVLSARFKISESHTYYLLRQLERYGFVHKVKVFYMLNPYFAEDTEFYRNLSSVGRQSKKSLPIYILKTLLYNSYTEYTLHEFAVYFHRKPKVLRVILEELQKAQLIQSIPFRDVPTYKLNPYIKVQKHELIYKLERLNGKV